MSATVGQILELLNEMAPPELKEDYDNIGLLVGHPERSVEKILVALDLTMETVREATEAGVQLIVTHHPVFFRGRKHLREDDPEGAAVCAMVRAGIALIAAHTNYDNAPCGVNDALSEALGLEKVEAVVRGLRIGTLRERTTARFLGDWVEGKLGGRARVYVSAPETPVERVAVCGGSGGDFWPEALQAGAQAFVTGEVSYHDALNAVAQGLCIVEAGHYETEHIAVKLLADGLQRRINEVQYNVTVNMSASTPFWRL